MKNLLLPFTLFLFFFGITINSSGQATIWSEDFSTYVEGTGIDGTGNIGDYPTNVTKWTLDVSGCTLSNADDYIKTDYEKLKSQDLDGPAVWLSENIDLSAYSTGATFSIKFYEYSSMEADDYIDVHYQLDGGDFVLIPNWNGHGSDIHTLIDDFSKDTVVHSVSACNNIVIKVTFNNNSGYEEFQMDDVFVYPNMEYVSSITTQNTYKIAAGKTNRQIIGMEVVTAGTKNPLNISSFTVNANGSTTPLSNNIENAKIFYTGTDNTFATDTQFGSTYPSPTTTNFDIAGTQQLLEGTNYFWLTFDIKTGAIIGELIDAEYISFVVEGSTETPTITAPAGSRTIAAPLSGDYTIGAKSNYTSFTDAVSDLNNLGISDPVSFSVASGTYTEQVSLSAIDGVSTTDTIVFQSNSGNRADVILQYEPTSDQANHILKFDGTDYITFQNMTLNNTGTSAYGRVVVFAGATNNINVIGCNINGRDANHENNVDYIIIKGESGTSNMASNITFDNDTIRYGSYGLYFSGGDNNNLETGIKISNSVFEDFYYAGIFLFYQDSVVIHSNKLTGKGIYDYEYGVFLMYCYGGYEITANMVFLSAEEVNTGIRLLECHASATRYALVANNYFSQVSTGGAYGIDVSDCSYQKIYHNSINMRSSAKSGTGGKSFPKVGCYFDCTNGPGYGNVKMLNNIIKSADKVISVTQDAVSNGYLEGSDNNGVYTTGATFGDWGDYSAEDLIAWYLASGHDGNSVQDDPGFLTSEVPDIGNGVFYGSCPMTMVDMDIYGEGRVDPTTPGAVEYKDNIIFWKVNPEDDNWNNPNNWEQGRVPTANDDVTIGLTATEPKLTEDSECKHITIKDAASLDFNGNKLSVGGDFIVEDGSTVVGSGTVGFVGPNDSEITSGEATMPVISVNKTNGAELSLYDALVVQALTILEGNLNANNKDVEIRGEVVDLSGGNFTNPSNTKLTSPGTVQFNPGSNTFNNLSFTGGGTYDLLAKLIVEGDFWSNGTSNVNENDVEFRGDVYLDGIFQNNTGISTLYLMGDKNQTVNSGNNTFGYFCLDIRKYGDGMHNVYWHATDDTGLNCGGIGARYFIDPNPDKGSYTIEFDVDIICNGDFTIGTPDTGNVIVNVMPGRNLTVNGTTIINNTGSLVLRSDATATLH